MAARCTRGLKDRRVLTETSEVRIDEEVGNFNRYEMVQDRQSSSVGWPVSLLGQCVAARF
jgi:hypothetical protein